MQKDTRTKRKEDGLQQAAGGVGAGRIRKVDVRIGEVEGDDDS